MMPLLLLPSLIYLGLNYQFRFDLVAPAGPDVCAHTDNKANDLITILAQA